MSASFAMMQLLQPLKWAHLHVPLVPAAMMDELIHYPAPFMLGFPTDEKDSSAILSALPSDVTLVDLDVGRVILASVFSNDTSNSAEGVSSEDIAGALRSQTLFLAESLGGAFAAAICRESWCSDSPMQQALPAARGSENFSEVLSICKEFVSELLSGKLDVLQYLVGSDSAETTTETFVLDTFLAMNRHSFVLSVDRRTAQPQAKRE